MSLKNLLIRVAAGADRAQKQGRKRVPGDRPVTVRARKLFCVSENPN